MTSALMDKD